ncbi:MAG: hypothetical protein NTX61_12090 [Bacteroidetes bacterium]|nr:hypothetical protein [Bacteroidota bacterium]
MKKNISALIIALFAVFSSSYGQDTIKSAGAFHPNYIESGFYIKVGPVFPMNKFTTQQRLKISSSSGYSIYDPAKMGAAMDMGYLIYLGPSFAGNHMRAGIDATFLSLFFNPSKHDSTTGSDQKKYWYYFAGQKFGPVLTINPVDRLMIDLSYKLNANIGFVHHPVGTGWKDEWGHYLTSNEVSMNIRYRIILFSCQYNFGTITYDNFGSAFKYKIENSTLRILIGFSF